jgi:multidrug efflux pump subunit AcrA (membrane-fusion protein)
MQLPAVLTASSANLVFSLMKNPLPYLFERTQSVRQQPRWVWLVLVISILVALGWAYKFSGSDAGGGDKRGKGDGRPVPVAIATVTQGDMDVILNALGTVTALNTVTVKPRVDGLCSKKDRL